MEQVGKLPYGHLQPVKWIGAVPCSNLTLEKWIGLVPCHHYPRHNYSSTVRDLHHQFLPPSTEDNNNFNLEEEEVSSDDPLRPQSLVAIFQHELCSVFIRAFFTRPELKGKNVSGMRGKEQLDPEQITKIKNFVYEFYPTPPSERELVWRECRKAIDSYLRKAFPGSS